MSDLRNCKKSLTIKQYNIIFQIILRFKIMNKVFEQYLQIWSQSDDFPKSLLSVCAFV